MIKRVLTGLCALAAGSLLAGTATWVGGSSVFWDDAANWTGDCATGYPAAGDTAVFDEAAGGSVRVGAEGVTVAKVDFKKGAWTIQGGKLTVSSDYPFPFEADMTDMVTFECPVYFSNTAVKWVYGGKTYRNEITAAGNNRLFFTAVKEASEFQRSHYLEGSGCVADLTNLPNVAAGSNLNNSDTSGHLFLSDGATLRAKIFFDFAFSSVTISNASLTTTASGTAQSLDLVSPSTFTVLAGGQATAAGKLDLGQNKTSGNVVLRIEGGKVKCNYLVVTRPWANEDITFARPADGVMGQLETASWGAFKEAGTPFAFSIGDAGVAEPGMAFTLITDGSGTKTVADYSLTRATVGGKLEVASGKLIFRIADSDYTWTGDAGDGKFSSGANWYCGQPPSGGEEIVFKNVAEPLTVTNDLVGYSPKAVTFQKSCTAPVTIAGEALTNVTGINNMAPAMPVFACPVTFVNTVDLYLADANVNFAGGVTGDLPGRLCAGAYTFVGHYTFTHSTDEETSWKPAEVDETFTIAPGSSVTFPGTNYFNQAGENNLKTRFVIEAGATMNVGMLRLRDNYGHFQVKGTLNVGYLWSYGWNPDPFLEGSTGTVNAETIAQGTNGKFFMHVARVNVGAGGLIEGEPRNGVGTQTPYYMVDGQVLGALADWTYQPAVQSANYRLTLDGRLTLDTTDAADGETPRTITLAGPISGEGSVAVVGNGTLDLTAYRATYSLGGAFALAAGTTVRMDMLSTIDGALELPSEGAAAVRLVTENVPPRGAVLKLFSNTGLDAATPVAERLAVTLEDRDDVEGELSVTEAGDVVWTVTKSTGEQAALTWRPGETAEWSAETVAWTDANGTASAFKAFASAVLDGQDETDGTIDVPADVTVGAITLSGEKDYTFTGAGTLVGNAPFEVLGGTLTLAGADLTYQPLVIENALVKLGDNPSPTALGTAAEVTIRAGGALDVNQAGSNVTNENVHCKAFYVCGSGPDGLGALRNSTVAATPTPSLFSEIHLTGDTTIGGPGRLDLRPLASSRRGRVAADMIFEGSDAVTLTVTGQVPGSNWGFNLNNCPNATVGRVVIDAGIMTLDAGTVLRCPNGVTLKNGGILYGFGLTKPQDFDVTVGEGDGALRCANGSMTTTGKIVVPEGATLTMSGTITHTGEVENHGTINVTGGTVKFTGTVTGNGVFSGVRIENWPSSAEATYNLAGTTSFAAPGFKLDGGTINAQGAFTAPSATVAPVVDFNAGTINLTGNLAANGARPTTAWGQDEAGDVTINLNGFDYTCMVPLAGKSAVTLVGPGSFASDSGWQNALDGHWTVNVGESLCNLGGASAFRAGLTLGENARVQLNIGADGEHCVESAVLTMTSWDAAKAYTGDYPQFVTHLKMLHQKSDAPAISTVAYYYRGKFLVTDDEAGTWYFGAQYDDRVILEIDGSKVVEATESGTPFKGSRNLTAGWHAFRIVAWDNTGKQGPTHADWTGKMALGWTTTEPAEPLKASSYNRFDSSTLRFRPLSTVYLSHRNSNADADWASATNWDSENAITNTVTGINRYGEDSEASFFNSHLNRLTGKFYIPAELAGTWSLRGSYDDRIGFWIDGTRILYGNGSGERPTATYTATEGWHDFGIRTLDGAGHFGPSDQAAAIMITLEDGTKVPFDESTFDFTVRSLDNLPVPGLFGDVALGAGAELLNGSAFPAETWPEAFCPIYGTVYGPGTLVSNFRFVGGRLGVRGDGKAPAVPAFGEASRADTLAELGGVDCRFESRPVFERIVLAPALGLTDDVARKLPITVAIDGLGDAAAERYAKAMRLKVADGQLLLINPLGASTFIIFR